MGTIGFSSIEKIPDVKKAVPDKNWYKPICHKCPYFIDHGTHTTKDNKEVPAVSCERSTYECLGDSLLVQQFEIIRQYKRVAMLKQKTDVQFPLIKHKKIKRRR